MVSTCMLRRILKKADAITRKPIAVDASRVEASTSAWRSDVPPSATCGEKAPW